MSLRYVYGQDHNVARFVAQMIPHVDPRGFPASATAIGLTDANNKPVGGIVFYNHLPQAGTVEIAIAALPGTRWLTRETMRHMTSYVFDRLGCQMGVFRGIASDRSVRRQHKAFGSTIIEVPRLYGRDVDGVICTYTDDQWAQSRFNRPAALQQKDAA